MTDTEEMVIKILNPEHEQSYRKLREEFRNTQHDCTIFSNAVISLHGCKDLLHKKDIEQHQNYTNLLRGYVDELTNKLILINNDITQLLEGNRI